MGKGKKGESGREGGRGMEGGGYWRMSALHTTYTVC